MIDQESLHRGPFAYHRNVGLFDSVSAAANIPFARLTLIYAENGRGKTNLAAILRSLASGDPIPIAERRRLAAQHPPHVILDSGGGPPQAMFQNNAWNRTLSNLAVFDDTFVDQNVYSGLAVEAGHRQNLHELILGAQAVLLNQQLQQLIGRIEEHNVALRKELRRYQQQKEVGSRQMISALFRHFQMSTRRQNATWLRHTSEIRFGSPRFSRHLACQFLTSWQSIECLEKTWRPSMPLPRPRYKYI